MKHRRIITVVLGCSAFMAIVSAGLPVAPTAASARPAAPSDASSSSTSGAIALRELTLGQPSGQFSTGEGEGSGPECVPGAANIWPANVSLSAATDGSAVLTMTAGGRLSFTGPVVQSSTTPGDIELDLSFSSSAESGSLTLTGYGTSFSGAGRLSTGPCTVRWPSTTLTLDGTGLTVIGQQAPPTTTATPPPNPSGNLDGFWVGLYLSCEPVADVPDPKMAVPDGNVSITNWDPRTGTFDWAFSNAFGVGTESGTAVKFSNEVLPKGETKSTVGTYYVSSNGTTLVMTQGGSCGDEPNPIRSHWSETFTLVPCSGDATPAAASSPAQATADRVADGAVSQVGLPTGAERLSFGATAGRRQPDALIPAVTSSADCLQVFIKIVGPIPGVGTRSGLSVDKYVPDDGPANFTRLTGAPHEATPLVAVHQVGQQCVSGCANILITVVNKVTHEPATNTEVNVQLGTIDTEESPTLYQQGSQFLCVQTGDFEHQDCGTSLDRLRTDDSGQVRLLYWAPGELVTAHVELYAQACTPSACALKRAEQVITVEPYRIYHYQGELSTETVVALVAMVRADGVFELWSHSAEQGLERVAEQWSELEGVESTAVKLALAPLGFGVIFTLADLAHATSEVLEETGLRRAFFDASGLSEAGLYAVRDPSAFAKVLFPGDAVYFEDLVLDGGKGFSLPFGWLWQLGQRLAEEYSKYNEWPPRTAVGLVTLKGVKPEPLSLSVYEVSYCKHGADCGPGYSPLHSPDMRPDLCVYISQLDAGLTCGIYYDAPIWAVSQEELDKDLHQQPAFDPSMP